MYFKIHEKLTFSTLSQNKCLNFKKFQFVAKIFLTALSNIENQ